MYTKDLVPGTPIELSICIDSGNISLYSSIVDAFHGDLLIKRLEYNGKLLGIPEDCSVDLLYIDPKTSRPYIWKNVSLKAVRYKKEVYHCIGNLLEEGLPINRRQAFRLFIGQEMSLIASDAEGPHFYRVLLKDVSETGMGFITSTDFPLKKPVRLEFKDNSFSMHLSGNIVRKKLPKEGESSILYGCRFTELNSLLAKYIAKKQLEKLHAQRS